MSYCSMTRIYKSTQGPGNARKMLSEFEMKSRNRIRSREVTWKKARTMSTFVKEMASLYTNGEDKT